jgi:hypothetical protein
VQVVAGLQERNEQLALKSAQLSEADYESIRSEFETRLAAAERKVYALTKERDALRKGAEKLADYGALIKEKDDIIKQVCVEQGGTTEGARKDPGGNPVMLRGWRQPAQPEHAIPLPPAAAYLWYTFQSTAARLSALWRCCGADLPALPA